MKTLPELHWHLGDDFEARLRRDYHLDAADIERINAVCVAWGEEPVNGTMSEMKRDLERRVMEVLR